MSRPGIAMAFESQAARVGASVVWTMGPAASADALALLRQSDCRTVALADILPQRSAFVDRGEDVLLGGAGGPDAGPHNPKGGSG
jgi:hypothetical protein